MIADADMKLAPFVPPSAAEMAAPDDAAAEQVRRDAVAEARRKAAEGDVHWAEIVKLVDDGIAFGTAPPAPPAPAPPVAIARRFTPAPAAAPEPGAIHCDCQDDPEPTPADGIAAMAAERIASEDGTADRFNALHDAEDERVATATMPVVDATSTATIAAVTDGGAA